MGNIDDYGTQLEKQEEQQKVGAAILGAYYMAFSPGEDLNNLPAAEQEKQNARIKCSEMHQLKSLEVSHLGKTGIDFEFSTPSDISSDLIGTFIIGNHTFKAIFPLSGTVYYTVTDGETGETKDTADIKMFEGMVENSVKSKKIVKKSRGLFSGLFR